MLFILGCVVLVQGLCIFNLYAKLDAHRSQFKRIIDILVHVEGAITILGAKAGLTASDPETGCCSGSCECVEPTKE